MLVYTECSFDSFSFPNVPFYLFLPYETKPNNDRISMQESGEDSDKDTLQRPILIKNKKI